jgi:hypothetical protein
VLLLELTHFVHHHIFDNWTFKQDTQLVHLDERLDVPFDLCRRDIVQMRHSKDIWSVDALVKVLPKVEVMNWKAISMKEGDGVGKFTHDLWGYIPIVFHFSIRVRSNTAVFQQGRP